MADTAENNNSVIRQTDPHLPEFVDFKKLRKAGLEHIGKLSGKIWTDHNVHDPGITILEVLIYALMDLAYKTNLPFEDLITPENREEPDDNFLTPLEVLTINPVTVTDYRKLLLEIMDVRNAWLEPAGQEQPLYINPQENELSCHPAFPTATHLPPEDAARSVAVQLNGLYRIYIEKETGVDDDKALKEEVIKQMSAHRNLCEDVVEVIILKPLEIGVCVEAELESGADAAAVYRQIRTAVRELIQPSIRYYTLAELLDKGRSIDEIFAGRPYSRQSFGFVDTEELENLEKRRYIHLSDLYHVILSIEGVRRIKNIHIEGGRPINEESPEWVESTLICEDEAPVFSEDKTCIDLYRSGRLVEIDKTNIHKSFSAAGKYELPLRHLDAAIPYGSYLQDLGDYYSIQHDFPMVYGLGDEGLPESATLLRKTQALQLKGYLLFYDQLLANYTAGLANLRKLFSLKEERQRSDQEKQTLFVQVPESIPGLEALIGEHHPPVNGAPGGNGKDIAEQTATYLKQLRELSEPGDEYTAGRKQFLDHLLARFGEEFTDYTILQYRQTTGRSKRNGDLIEEQSAFIKRAAEISRNRGKAFDYLEPSWNTGNVSGFEKRVSLLAGMNPYKRRNLCNFEVTPCHKLILKDWKDNVLFRSSRSYETKEELKAGGSEVLKQLRDPESYRHLEKKLTGFDAAGIRRIFSSTPADENITVTRYHHRQQLLNSEGEVVAESLNKKISSQKKAVEGREAFIQSLRKEKTNNKGPARKAYHLIPVDEKNRYLDVHALNVKMTTLKSWKWHVFDPDNGDWLASSDAFEEPGEAWDHVVEHGPVDRYVTGHDVALQWRLTINEWVQFTAVKVYPDAYKAVTAWRQAKALGSSAGNFEIKNEEDFGSPAGDIKEESAGEVPYRIQLKDENGNVIAVSEPVHPADCDRETAKSDSEKVFGNRNTTPHYEKVSGKFGFIVPVDDEQVLESYCVFDTKKEALEKIGEVYDCGKVKKNYFLSGDEGNPEYNFILRDRHGSFLALCPDHFETAPDRNKALNIVIRFFKKNEVPVSVREQPRRYTWTLYDEGHEILSSGSEFLSEQKARENFERVVSKEALTTDQKFFKPLIYTFQVWSDPAQFKFLYGTGDSKQAFTPVFISSESFTSRKDLSQAYSEFHRALPRLALQKLKKKRADFALIEPSADEPVAVQFRKGGRRAPYEAAEALVNYMSSIYTEGGKPRESYVMEDMDENPEGAYEWRFLKKNNPLAVTPYCCPDEASANRIKALICDRIPPVDLRECPPADVVVCPEKSPHKFHYRVWFRDNEDREFELISYTGFGTRKEARDAWEKAWLDVIELAADPDQYGEGGKISLDEVYRDPESGECLETSFVAVIPERIKQELEEKGENVTDTYVRLADLFPIYKTGEDDEVRYKFRVVVPQENLIRVHCEYTGTEHKGSLIWVSAENFNSVDKALKAYRYFYVLAGISNNCRVLCRQGCYYVGLIEVMAESFCEFESEAEAWDDHYPGEKDLCDHCVSGGVRAFVDAVNEGHHFMPVQEQKHWTFKVVSPAYYVADHACSYKSAAERDEYMETWAISLKELDWKRYIVQFSGSGSTGFTFDSDVLKRFMRLMQDPSDTEEICRIIHAIRECAKRTSRKGLAGAALKNALAACLRETFRDERYAELVGSGDIEAEELAQLAAYFPVVKTDRGYCFRLYWPENDKVVTEEGLQPCGCEEDEEEEKTGRKGNGCDDPYPFVSSNCYGCCAEALKAFAAFAELIKQESYALDCTSESENGPHSFRILDKSRVLAYHPQKYEGLQQVREAIEITRTSALDTGLHLLEHLLLRPKNPQQCSRTVHTGDDVGDRVRSCLLPVCPDYDCMLKWEPEAGRLDPCDEPEDETFRFLPGSDPYSFWATVILPAWSKRFRTRKARSAFETLLYQEVPALTGLHILWLSPRNMCRFEDVYRKWLEWMQDPDAGRCDSNGADPHCLLADLIRELRSEEPCPPAIGEEGECRCRQMEEPDIDECCLPADTRGSIFWHDCHDENGRHEPVPTFVTRAEMLESLKEGKPPETSEKRDKPAKKTPGDPKDLIRRRDQEYLSNVEAVADENMLKTKSYERTLSFLKKKPAVDGFAALVKFFDRYSLKPGYNVEGFLELLQNAAWHLFDRLVIEREKGLDKQESRQLKECMEVLKKHGLKLPDLEKNWKSGTLKPVGHTRTMNQIKIMLT